jgi:hypothetical protein
MPRVIRRTHCINCGARLSEAERRARFLHGWCYTCEGDDRVLRAFGAENVGPPSRRIETIRDRGEEATHVDRAG